MKWWVGAYELMSGSLWAGERDLMSGSLWAGEREHMSWYLYILVHLLPTCTLDHYKFRFVTIKVNLFATTYVSLISTYFCQCNNLGQLYAGMIDNSDAKLQVQLEAKLALFSLWQNKLLRLQHKLKRLQHKLLQLQAKKVYISASLHPIKNAKLAQAWTELGTAQPQLVF